MIQHFVTNREHISTAEFALQICQILSYFWKRTKGYLSSDNDQALKLESGVKIGVFED